MEIKKIKTQNGFSLIELMVVVAIIAIVSMFAIPSYQSYQARARQKEGILLLESYYTAAQSTRTEFGIFPGNFVQTGFQPVGTLGYRVQVADGNDISTINDDSCFRTQEACNCSGTCASFKTWAENPNDGSSNPNVIGIGDPALGSCGGSYTTTDSTFIALAAGRISTSSTRVDLQSIDHMKNLTICDDGTK